MSSSSTDSIKAKAEKSVESHAEELREKAKETASSLASEVKSRASDIANSASEQARDYGESRKNAAAAETSKVANALRKASTDLADGSPQERVFGQMANGVADFADGLRDKSVDQIGRDVSQFARRNPAAFLGGAALLGFAAARFLRASGDREDSRHSGAEPHEYRHVTPPASHADGTRDRRETSGETV